MTQTTKPARPAAWKSSNNFAPWPDRLHDTIVRENLKPILDEIAAEIGQNTLDRMAAFLQNAADEQTPDNEKLALAVSGWPLGADAATPKLPVALSAYKVRGLIRGYLNRNVAARPREDIQLHFAEAGGNPAIVAELLHNETAIRLARSRGRQTGLLRNRSDGIDQGAAGDLLRAIAAGILPLSTLSDDCHASRRGRRREQIDWWAGDWSKAGVRTGQATRHGYIVIAPAWTEEHQKRTAIPPGNMPPCSIRCATLVGDSRSTPIASTFPAIRWAATRHGTSAWRIPISGRA